MKSVWKLVCLLGLVALVAVTAFACAVLSQGPPLAVPRPLTAACAAAALGCAVIGIFAVFTKRHTSATGFG
jgi:hypothetical protein